MEKLNYIASAGTGKTYRLVKSVIDKLKEGNSLDSFLILTFTEKAAGEIKERLYTEISQIIETEKDPVLKKRFHSELLKIDLSYIGTFHSVFLRFLKKYPEKTGIDSSTKIYHDSMLKQFLLKEFELWIEEDFKEHKKLWEEIGNLSGSEIFELFYTLYINRMKINRVKKDIRSQKEKIINLTHRLEGLVDSIIDKYGKVFLSVRQKGLSEKIFNNDPFLLKTAIQEMDFSRLNLNLTDRGFILKGRRGGSRESREFLEKEILPALEDDFFAKDQEIYKTIEELYREDLDYRANIILDRFFSFNDFFEDRKKEEEIIDFDDILIKTDQLLDEDDIKKELISGFECIFVDEFQDTDRLQISVLEKFSQSSIYIFGDPKQCIYQWRAADLEGYFRFVERFDTVTLDKNYRSSKKIVDFVNSVLKSEKILSHIDEKYRKPVKPNTDNEGDVQIKDISQLNISQEEYLPYLINELKEYYDYSQIMILVRTNNLLQKIVKSLQENNIPVKTSGSGNIFETEEIKTVLNFLRFIENPEKSVNVIKVLKSPVVMIDDSEIYRKKHNLSKYNHPVVNLLLTLSQKKFSISPYDIVNEIYRKTDILPVFSSFEDGNVKVKNLNRFIEIVHRLSQENYNIRDIILYSETISEPAFETEEENAVEVLTIHRAKGLEKEVVILPFMDKDPYRIMERTVYYKNGSFILNHPRAKSENYHCIKEELEEDAVNEMERLLYVALTRAKERIYILRSEKNLRKNSFLKMIEGSVNLADYTEKVEKIRKTEREDIQKIPEIQLKEAEETEKFLKREKEISDDTERFTTVSRLMEKDRTDSLKKSSEISIYTGIVVHSVLEKTDFKNFSYQKALQEIKKILESIPPNLRKEVEKRSADIMRIFESSEILDELRKSRILFREVPFVIKEGNSFIEGRIDVVYQKDGKIYVMDYKTTAYSSEEEIKNRYKTQEKYYLKAISRIFPQKNVHFKIGMLLTGKIV